MEVVAEGHGDPLFRLIAGERREGTATRCSA
jgi:hypothetical protein